MKKMYVQEIIDYIENHIYDNFTIEEISDYIGYSKFYLNKLFRIYTGMSIMYYARKRKLEYALSELSTSMAIIDIAVKYGFGSRRSFSRLFTSFYQNAPSTFRKKDNALPPKIILNNVGGIRMLPYLSEPFEKELDTLYVLSKQVISKNPEDDVIALQQAFKENHHITTVMEVGFDVPVSDADQNNQLRGYEYWLCVSKEDFDTLESDDTTKKVIPASNYLCLTIEDPFLDPFERIPNGWKKLSSILVSDYTYNDLALSCGLEHVEDVNGTTVMHLYIPIK